VEQNLDQILHSYHEKRLSHAFLIETNDQEKCLSDLKKIICSINCEFEYRDDCEKCNLCHLIQTDHLPSLIVIRPDGQNIRKEQVLDLKQKFSTKPIYSKFNIYIIMYSEKLNSSSANTLLKFLEEPEEGILGFFLTNNKENIIDTIKSRCQIISNFYPVIESSNELLEEKAVQLLRETHLSKELALLFNKNLLMSGLTKDDLQAIFQIILRIYYYFYKAAFLNSLDNLYSDLSFLKKKTPEYLYQQLKLVQNLELELNSNVNLNLLLDRFVLETR